MGAGNLLSWITVQSNEPGRGRPLGRFKPSVSSCRLCRSASGLHCPWGAQPATQRVSKTKITETGAQLHNQVSAFTRDQSRRGERSALTSDSYWQHYSWKMDMHFKAKGQSTGPSLSMEGLLHQAAEQELIFSLTDPINLIVLAEQWQSLSADMESTSDPLVSLRGSWMAYSFFFLGAFVDLGLNVLVPQLSLSRCKNKHVNVTSCTMGITKIAG